MDRASGSVASLLAALPRGGGLPEADWSARHRLLTAILAIHLPVLLLVGTVVGSWSHTLVWSAAVALCLAIAARPGRRLHRSLAATLGLLTCSAMLVDLFNGLTEMHFHYFVVIALVALYQDWRSFAVAFVFVIVEHTVIALVDYSSIYSHPDHGADSAVGWALLHGAFLLAAAGAQMVFWSRAEQSSAQEELYRRKLIENELGVLARMREVNQAREDVIASVSHEFRTPLTAIRGSSATLRAHGDRINPEVRDALLAGIAEHGERLSRLLEDMLTAASASATDPTAIADVSEAIGDLVGPDGRSGALTATSVPHAAAYIGRTALRQVLGALVDHSRDHARQDRQVSLRASVEGRQVLLTLSYTALPGAESVSRLFEPFSSRQAARTGRASSLSLFLVRRLVKVHGGSVTAFEVDGGSAEAAPVEDGQVDDAVGSRDGRQVRIETRLRALRHMVVTMPEDERIDSQRVIRSG